MRVNSPMKTSHILAATMFTAFIAGLPSRALAQDYKAYQNYDFVPGDRIVFEDDFRGDKDGEFPSHWKLNAGQGVVNQMNGAPVLALTEGNYAKVEPRITAKSYLGDIFTIEADFYAKDANQLIMFLVNGDQDRSIHFKNEVSTEGLD